MASIKEASESAIAFAQQALGNDRIKGARLEEVESVEIDGKDCWLITLSMLDPDDMSAALTLNPFSQGRRTYKKFAVQKHDSQVLSMTIRELTTA
jgi:hypothetical protein